MQGVLRCPITSEEQVLLISKDGDDDYNDDNSDIKPGCPITSEEQVFALSLNSLPPPTSLHT